MKINQWISFRESVLLWDVKEDCLVSAPFFINVKKFIRWIGKKFLRMVLIFFHVNLNQFWKWSILSFSVLFYFHLENFISKTYFDVLRVIKDLLHIQTMFRLIKWTRNMIDKWIYIFGTLCDPVIVINQNLGN